jgi:hypothetical protein
MNRRSYKVWNSVFLVPLISLVIGGSENEFGFSIHFLFYEVGEFEALQFSVLPGIGMLLNEFSNAFRFMIYFRYMI